MPIASRENYSNVSSYEAPTQEMPVVTQDVIEGEQARIDSINRERGENEVDISYQDSMDQDSAVLHEINSLVLPEVPNNMRIEERNFDDQTRAFAVAEISKIALGNSDVPVGQYSEELLKNLKIWDEIQKKVTLGSNVKEVTTWIKEGVANCGIIYATDAYSAGLEVVATAKEGMIKTPVLYPAAVLKNSKNSKEAKEFLEFLKGDECKAIFEKVGFTRAK